MKKRVFFVISCLCLILLFPISVKAVSSTSKIVPDSYTPEGKAVFLIDVSRENWENNFSEHPYFKNHKANQPIDAVFRLPDVATRAVCYNCNTNNMSLQREWVEAEYKVRKCPAMEWQSDIRIGWTWRNKYICSSCGYQSAWSMISDRNEWDWYMYCYDDNYELKKGYRIDIGGTINSGGNIHTYYSIREHDEGIVHGINCCPTLIYLGEAPVPHGPGCCCYGSHHAYNNVEGRDDD